MGKIVILDENTANQIAAGEVIERPASIVKEMVENSLDANATAITVDIVNGGIKSIRIIDNGDGMEADDVELAFERHATSKIRKIEDLNRLSTMGFRGEALASIASVAKVEVVTKTEQAQGAVKVVIEAGNILLQEPAGAPKGTTFTVRELFFNTPARYKFLKKDTTEAGYIQDILTRIALARPDVSFKLLSQGRPLLHTPGNHDLLSVIYSVYGKEIARAVVPIHAVGEGVEVTGYAGKPEIARGNRSFQSILVNGRFVYNRVITAALEEAYKTRLMQKRFPFAVLKLNLSPTFVDVNVHPSKLEVRFSDEQKVFRAVYHAVSEALTENASFRAIEDTAHLRLSSASGYPAPRQASPAAVQQQQVPYAGKPKSNGTFGTINATETVNLEQAEQQAGSIPAYGQNHAKALMTPNISGSQYHQPLSDGTEPAVLSNNRTAQTEHDKPTENPESNLQQFSATAERIFHPVVTGRQTQVFQAGEDGEIKSQAISDRGFISEEPEELQTQEDQHSSAAAVKDKERLLRSRVIGQAFGSYILLEDGEEILLIDQHAAHERIRYEKLKEQFIHQEAFGQGLLSPLAVNLSELEMERFHELSEYLNKLGFEAEIFGNRSILIRAVPYVLDSSFSGQDFLEILEKLSQEAPSASEIIPEETLYMMACKSAIKANRTMSPMEIRGLVDELAHAQNPYTCVHGRPVIISMSKKELEKRFKRIV